MEKKLNKSDYIGDFDKLFTLLSGYIDNKDLSMYIKEVATPEGKTLSNMIITLFSKDKNKCP